MLLAAGATVDILDAKAQTPLFVSLVNQHWECARQGNILSQSLTSFFWRCYINQAMAWKAIESNTMEVKIVQCFPKKLLIFKWW